MVRHYVRKTNHGSWSEDDLQKAIRACKRLSIRAAAKKYGIPYGTIHRHMYKEEVKKNKTGSAAVFTLEQEEELVAQLQKMTNTYFGISQKDLRKVAYEFAEGHQLSHPFKSKTAGFDWSSKFLAHHPEVHIRSLRGPRVPDDSQIVQFYKRLTKTLDQYQIDCGDVYTVDEIGIVYAADKSPKLEPVSGGWQVDSVFQSGGQLMTAVCCFSVTGNFLPPTFVFSCELVDKELPKKAPLGSVSLFSEDGWTNREVFADWLTFFVKHVRPSKQARTLLVLDNDESHVSLGAYDYAVEHGIIILSVPTHTSETLLPLHCGLFTELSTNFDEAVREKEARTCGHVCSEPDLVALFGKAYAKSCSVYFAAEGFKSSGIYPCQRIIGDDDSSDSIISEDEEHLIDALYFNSRRNGRMARTVENNSGGRVSPIKLRVRPEYGGEGRMSPAVRAWVKHPRKSVPKKHKACNK